MEVKNDPLETEIKKIEELIIKENDESKPVEDEAAKREKKRKF
jgi:hypothetical protein